MSLDHRGLKTLKKRVYTHQEVKTWLSQKKKIDSEITAGETGEAFAVYFFPTARSRSANFKKLVGNIAQLMDKDKPYAGISSIRLETFRGKTALRIGWAS